MTSADLFLVIMGILAIPWGGWVSLMLFKMNRDLGVSDARQDGKIEDLEERVDALEGLFPRTVSAT